MRRDQRVECGESQKIATKKGLGELLQHLESRETVTAIKLKRENVITFYLKPRKSIINHSNKFI